LFGLGEKLTQIVNLPSYAQLTVEVETFTTLFLHNNTGTQTTTSNKKIIKEKE